MRGNHCGWLRNVAVACALCVLPVTAPAQDAPKSGVAAKLPAVRIDGNYFSAEGKRFLAVGAHWVPAKAAMQWPVQWDPKDIEADFAKMHELGYNITRFDMMWAWFEPRPGDYNPVAFRTARLPGDARAQVQNLSAPEPVHRRRSRRSLLGCSVAHGPSSPCRSGNAAAGNESGGGVWPEIRQGNRHHCLGPDRRAAVLDCAQPADHRCDGH